MRLINARSLNIEEFGPRKLPKYAILSHTWGDCEPTHAEWRSKVTRRWHSGKPGFAKIFGTCKQACRDGLSHVWVDTVCIDKTSSAELSEAINSMFEWYEKAEVCYVYLTDIKSPPRGVDLLELMGSSRWFSRGWTLQELLAPDHVEFFSKSWTHLGSKKALASFLSVVTGVDQLCIRKEKKLRDYSVAQRMSWAADRVTTRPEDIAYCLLGIFGINMPLLYEEGENAFLRLQGEIIRQSDDHSILAFDTLLSTKNSLLAEHPNFFRNMRNLQPGLHSRITPPFAMTNAGLSMKTPLIQTLSPNCVLAVLNCVEVETKKGMRKSQICLPLLGKNGVYMRARAPFCLVRKNLSEMYICGCRTEIEDLTTSVETKFLVSYFTKVYQAFGYELDIALNGFNEETQTMRNPGFMLTFPRGMGNFQLVDAFPPDSLQMSSSFFNPPVMDSGQPFAHGLLIFQDMSKTSDNESLTRIGVYLAQSDGGMGGDFGGQWICVLTRVSDDFNMYEKCKESWQFENPDVWSHYDHAGKFLVAARTKFALQEPTREVVMVEIVFDADVLTEEQYVDTNTIQFSDWAREHGSLVGLGSEIVLGDKFSRRRAFS